uniref:MKRN2 opposite strand protein n=1 Tax=Steinernema glaseri TaxID=37863 RepID=A0A1I7ZVD9_9BILA
MALAYVSHHGCSTRVLTLMPYSKDVTCTSCGKPLLADTELPRAITDIPSPFAMQRDTSCSILIKPTNGSFMSHRLGENLHVGVSDRESVVYSYAANGVSLEPSGWDMTLIVFRLNAITLNETLRSFLSDHAHYFTRDSYRENGWNCFDFVIHFLAFAKLGRHSKAEFTRQFVTGPLRSAHRYTALVRKVVDNGPVIVNA